MLLRGSCLWSPRTSARSLSTRQELGQPRAFVTYLRQRAGAQEGPVPRGAHT